MNRRADPQGHLGSEPTRELCVQLGGLGGADRASSPRGGNSVRHGGVVRALKWGRRPRVVFTDVPCVRDEECVG